MEGSAGSDDAENVDDDDSVADEMSDDQKPVKPAVKQIGTYHQPRATFARLGGSFVLYL